MTTTQNDEHFIAVSQETIWHMRCGACGYYWTIPTMNPADDPSRRSWTCPLCARHNPAKRIDEMNS